MKRDRFESDMPMLEEGIEHDEIHSALADAMASYNERVYYLQFPNDYDELLEFVDRCVSKLADYKGMDEVLIGRRTSCTYNSPVIMVYIKGGIQYHINTVNMDDFDSENFTTNIMDEYGIEVFDIDEYLLRL